VTEQEWASCNDFERMLHFVGNKAIHKTGQRKLRLLLCGRWRQRAAEPHFSTSDLPLCLTAIELAERFADGFVTQDEANECRNRVGSLKDIGVLQKEPGWGKEGWNQEYYWSPANILCEALRSDLSNLSSVDWQLRAVTDLSCCDGPYELLLDLFGNPFRLQPAPNPIWLAWNDGIVKRLTEGVYEQRRFEDLSILADALEEAGCNNEAILAHCRGPGPHFRGCWVLDLLLGKE
jgi:hypothetical protein